MEARSRPRTVSARPSSRNAARPELPSFFLDPALYRALPARRRPQLVALLNLLVAYGRTTGQVRATQTELAELLALTVRQVRNLETDLEAVGAVRVLRGLPGLRGGRALELVALIDWVELEVLADSPAPVEAPSVGLPTGPSSIVENSATAEPCSSDGGIPFRPEARSSRVTARARQSTPENKNLKREPQARTPDAESAPVLARRMFGFLARKTGLSAKRWKDAAGLLEDLVRQVGPARAWDELERIERAARSAVNPGGYAWACLQPDPDPLTRRAPLRTVPHEPDRSPLFAGLDRRGSPAPASTSPSPTSGPSSAPASPGALLGAHEPLASRTGAP